MRYSQVSRQLTVAMLATVSWIAASGCGKKSNGNDVATALRELEPELTKLKAIRAVLPPVGKEQPLLDHPSVPTDPRELATIDLVHLEHLLGTTTTVEPWQRTLFDSPYLAPLVTAADAAALPDDADRSRAVSAMWQAGQALASVKHVLVFRTGTLDPGAIAKKMVAGSFVIERRARWAGWAFLVTYDAAPKLLAAFPIEATNGEFVSVRRQAGHRPHAGALAVEVSRYVRKALAEKLATANGMVDADAAACAKGDAKACLASARTQQTGRRTIAEAIAVASPAAPAKALPVYDKLCAASTPIAAEACLEAGLIYAAGATGIAKDPAKAAGLFERACTGGQPRACTELGLLVGSGEVADPVRAVQLFEQACKQGNGAGCHHAARYYRGGLGVAANKIRAATRSVRACTLGVREDCPR